MSWSSRGETPDGAGELFRSLLAAGRERAAERDRVVETVRAQAGTKSRDELRALFESELDRQGVPRDPIWVERQLDELTATPLERSRRIAKGFGLAATSLPKLLRGFSDAPQPETPAWMRKPARARYWAYAPEAVKVAVRLDRSAAGLLERVLAGAPQRVGNEVAVLEVWFDRDRSDGKTAVFVGEERVGNLEESPPHGLRTQMDAADRLEESTYASATLARARHLDPPYLLVTEIAPVDAPPRPTGPPRRTRVPPRT